MSLARDRNSDKINSPPSAAVSGTGTPLPEAATLAYVRPHPGGFVGELCDAGTWDFVDLAAVGGELDTTFFFFSSAWI